jgi:hypothetical protein
VVSMVLVGVVRSLVCGRGLPGAMQQSCSRVALYCYGPERGILCDPWNRAECVGMKWNGNLAVIEPVLSDVFESRNR